MAKFATRFTLAVLLAGTAPAPAQNQQIVPFSMPAVGSSGPNPWSYQHNTRARTLPAYQAATEDVVIGAKVYSTYGPAIGTVAHVDVRGTVVKTERSVARVPLSAFGKSQRGLLLEISAWQLDRLASGAGARQ